MLARRVRGNPKYENNYHEARYNQADCLLKLAMSRSGEERAKTLSLAVRSISFTFGLDRKMGGDAWYQKYDRLLKNIQRLQEVSATGLEGLNADRPSLAVPAKG